MAVKKGDDGYLHNDMGEVWGYCRVSTTQQKTDRQEIAMEEYGVPATKIFIDKQSGKSFNRPAYKKMIRILRKGDIIVIKSIDRLGRNYQEIIDQWRMITQDLGCGIYVIDMPLLNTTGDPEDLISKFITDMMLQVLSFVAQNERENTISRQREGIDAARRKRIVSIGRPKIPMPFDFWQIFVMWKKRECTTNDLFRYCHEAYGMSNRTFYRRINELNQRYGDLPPERLDDLILDKEFFNGIHFDNERIEQGIGYYNQYVLNNPEKERKLRERHRKEKEEKPELTKEEEEALQRAMLYKRQKEFRERFNMPALSIFDRTDMPTELIKRPDPIPPKLSKNGKRIGRPPNRSKTDMIIKGDGQVYNCHTKQSGVDQAVVLLDKDPRIPDIDESKLDSQKPMKTIVII
nr:MAG TPA: gamma delta Resolvase, site specific recombination [Caudoviricetes sp.]